MSHEALVKIFEDEKVGQVRSSRSTENVRPYTEPSFVLKEWNKLSYFQSSYLYINDIDK